MFFEKQQRYTLTMSKGPEVQVWKGLSYNNVSSLSEVRKKKGWVVLSIRQS